MRWRDAAVVALASYAHALTALRAGALIDPGVPVVVIWTAHAALREREARAILDACADIVVWRPDGAPAPAWLHHAMPVGPEMPARTLALMAKHALAAQDRRAGIAPRRRRGLGDIALATCIGISVAGMAAGVALSLVTSDPAPARAAAHRPPVTGLRGPT